MIPAQPMVVALYLRHLMEQAELKHNSFAVISNAAYGIQWGHTIAGLPSPLSHPIVKATMEGAKRALARPTCINPKEPMSSQSIQELAEPYNTPNATLKQVRLLFIVIVGYPGMMRVGELLAIRRKDITIDSDRMAIFLSKRKNGQYREGHTVNFRKSGKITCQFQ